jgi:molecular chaperone GrpE
MAAQDNFPPAPPVPGVAPTHPADRVAESAPADPAPDLAALLTRAETEAADLRDAWLRAKAETDNVRKQATNDLARASKFAVERFAGDLLAVRDSLEQTTVALAKEGGSDALKSGVELTLKQLVAAFERAQIVPVDPAGEKFDPHRHQAMAMVDADAPAGTVVTVFQKGYLVHDRVLRPALVAVAKAKEDAAPAA